jgi:lysophospholipase L1-like esterase
MKRLTALLSAAASAAVLGLTPTVAAAAHAATTTTPDQYVALGDSYSAGNGAFSTNLNSACNRNTYAYPYLTAQQRPNTALTFVACSGAKTTDVVNTQVSSLSASTNIVSITIGGNDVGFSNLIVNCIGWSDAQCKSAVDSTNSQIANQLPGELDTAYAAIRQHAPNATVVVLGYPRAFGTNYGCSAAAGVDANKVGWLNGVSDNLDATIGARARAAGFSYQSSIANFTGHDVCASTPWLNGTTFSLSDSWHPTRAGYANGFVPELRAVIG